MLELYPEPTVECFDACPHCGDELDALDFRLPGMHTLAELQCEECGRTYFGELPVGHAVHAPLLLDAETGAVHGNTEIREFGAKWLAEAYQNRTEEPVEIETREPGVLGDYALVFNCLDGVYGHALLKLLNCQYHIDTDREESLVALVPKAIDWLVPDGIDAVWTVPGGLDADTTWSDGLDAALRRRIEQFEACFLDPCFPVPPRDHVDIERFSGVSPFPREEWTDRLAAPTVTFVWRNQSKLWASTPRAPGRLRRARGYLYRAVGRFGVDLERREQIRNVVKLERRLRERFPDLDFAVAGLGTGGTLPDPIADHRVAEPDEASERTLCRRYADSHLVVGVHGSNMLLPSSHAGAAIELIPFHKWGNITEDLIPRREGHTPERDALYHNRMLPISTPVETVAEVVSTTLTARANRGWAKQRSDLGMGTWERAQAELLGESQTRER